MRFRMLCGEYVAAAVDEGIEAVVQFVSLAYESIDSGLDRLGLGHYRGCAGVDSARKTVYFRLSQGCEDYRQHAVGFSSSAQTQP